MNLLDYPLHDTGFAERFCALHGDDYRFVPELGWLRWDGRCWLIDRTKTVIESICHAVARTGAQVDVLPPKEAEPVIRACARYQDTARLYAVEKRLQTMRSIAVAPETLNADPWLLSHAGGTVDLRAGTTRDHDRADLITRCEIGRAHV